MNLQPDTTRCAWCNHPDLDLVTVDGLQVCTVCAAARAPVEEPH